MFAGSLRPFTHCPACHFSFFLLSNFVLTCLKPACVGRISHQGASKQCIRGKCYSRSIMERIHGRKLTVSDKIPLLMGLLRLKGLGTES